MPWGFLKQGFGVRQTQLTGDQAGEEGVTEGCEGLGLGVVGGDLRLEPSKHLTEGIGQG